MGWENGAEREGFTEVDARTLLQSIESCRTVGIKRWREMELGIKNGVGHEPERERVRGYGIWSRPKSWEASAPSACNCKTGGRETSDERDVFFN